MHRGPGGQATPPGTTPKTVATKEEPNTPCNL
jgi:hypothetical protein